MEAHHIHSDMASPDVSLEVPIKHANASSSWPYLVSPLVRNFQSNQSVVVILLRASHCNADLASLFETSAEFGQRKQLTTGPLIKWSLVSKCDEQVLRTPQT